MPAATTELTDLLPNIDGPGQSIPAVQVMEYKARIPRLEHLLGKFKHEGRILDEAERRELVTQTNYLNFVARPPPFSPALYLANGLFYEIMYWSTMNQNHSKEAGSPYWGAAAFLRAAALMYSIAGHRARARALLNAESQKFVYEGKVVAAIVETQALLGS